MRGKEYGGLFMLVKGTRGWFKSARIFAFNRQQKGLMCKSGNSALTTENDQQFVISAGCWFLMCVMGDCFGFYELSSLGSLGVSKQFQVIRASLLLIYAKNIDVIHFCL
jgi:hypothetical protein